MCCNMKKELTTGYYYEVDGSTLKIYDSKGNLLKDFSIADLPIDSIISAVTSWFKGKKIEFWKEGVVRALRKEFSKEAVEAIKEKSDKDILIKELIRTTPPPRKYELEQEDLEWFSLDSLAYILPLEIGEIPRNDLRNALKNQPSTGYDINIVIFDPVDARPFLLFNTKSSHQDKEIRKSKVTTAIRTDYGDIDLNINLIVPDIEVFDIYLSKFPENTHGIGILFDYSYKTAYMRMIKYFILKYVKDGLKCPIVIIGYYPERCHEDRERCDKRNDAISVVEYMKSKFPLKIIFSTIGHTDKREVNNTRFQIIRAAIIHALFPNVPL